MKTLRINSILFVFFAIANSIFGQSVLKIADVKIVAVGETLTIPAGTTIELGSGAVLQVEGSLIIKGTINNPVTIANADPNAPGLGIVITGSQGNGKVELSNVKFKGQIQPIRFDPFWHRKTVQLNGISIINCRSGEPLIYMATPLTDLREGRKINATFTDFNLVNNTSGILLEQVGSDGIIYTLDKLVCQDNYFKGIDNAMGLIHFDFAKNSKPSNVKIGNLSFIRNYAGSNPVGISVSGNGNQSLNIETIYQSDLSEDIIFDKHIDIRIPSVIVSKKEAIQNAGLFDLITGIDHQFGQVKMNVIGNPSVSQLLDSSGNKVDYTFVKKGDTMVFDYIQGNPAIAILTSGTSLNIPKFKLTSLQLLALSKIDTAEYNKYLRQKNIDNARDKSDVLHINVPMFKSKGELINKIGVWEIGMWGGGAFYGGGDIHYKTAKDFRTSSNFAKNTVLIKDFPVFSSIEYSFGGYGQYNINSRFALKGTFYYSGISIHNIWGAGIFSGTTPLMSYDQNYNEIAAASSSFPVNFWTKMGIVELEGLWHMRPYQISAGKTAKLVPSLGLSVGMLYFNTYRFAYSRQQSGEEFSEYVDRMKNEHLYNLRDLGSEGQNFLPGAKPYSPIAFNIGTSFSLTYLRKRWAFKGEMKAVYTSTDYLDDYGPGLWFGGDYDAMRAAAYDKYPGISESELNKISNYSLKDKIAPNAQRSTNGLNDWYFQFHLGASYILFK